MSPGGLTAKTLVPGAMVGVVQLLRPLGAGGMGAIWVGENTSTRTQVAVKFMLRDIAEVEPTAPERFDREGKILARIKHPHVVTLFENGSLADGTPYIVMELLSGESIVDRLERTERPFTLAQVTELLSQVCAALSAIHSQGIVHRDLKGENTFLLGTSESIYVKIIDFGLAKTPDMPGAPKLTLPGQQIGSPEYMSPEQVMSSGEADHRADLWAVGVLAYVALTLTFPFTSENLADLIISIRNGQFEPASRLSPGLTPAIDEWFKRAFQIIPSHRFNSAQEMLDTWRAATPHVQPAPQPGLAPQVAATPAKSNTPMIVGIIVGVVVVMALAIGLAMAL